MDIVIYPVHHRLIFAYTRNALIFPKYVILKEVDISNDIPVFVEDRVIPLAFQATLAHIVHENWGPPSFYIVGVEAVDGEVVGDHRGRVGAGGDDQGFFAVAGLEVVAGEQVVGACPCSGGRVPVEVVVGSGDGAGAGGRGDGEVGVSVIGR